MEDHRTLDTSQDPADPKKQSHVQDDPNILNISQDAPQPKNRSHIEEMYTVAEFLDRYKISRTEFYRQVNAGRIPLTKLGTASRITREHAEVWAASLPVRTGPLPPGSRRVRRKTNVSGPHQIVTPSVDDLTELGQ